MREALQESQLGFSGTVHRSAWDQVSLTRQRACADLFLGSWTGPSKGRDQAWQSAVFFGP